MNRVLPSSSDAALRAASLLVSASLLALVSATPAFAQDDAAAQASAAAPQDDASQEIIVTGQRASIASAINIKRNADQIVDSVTADDIGKLPDRSVTETLQRVTGVTIDHFMARNDPDHFSVEGSGVSIRGLTFVRSELNGRDSFSANGGRSLSFEDVPPELLAGVDVYKNPSAEMIEGGIGGLVNLRTRLPFDSSGQVISLSAQATRGDLRKKWEPSFSALYSNRWETGIGDVGVLFDVAFSRNSTRTDGIQVEPYYPRTDLEPGRTVWIPKGVNWRTLDFTRRRLGLYGALQWAPSSDVDVTVTAFQSRYKMHWDEHAIFSQTNAYNIVPAEGTQFEYDETGALIRGTETNPTDGGMPFNSNVRSADRDSRTTDISGNVKWRISDRLSANFDVQHVRATTNSFDSTVATGVNMPSQTIDLSGGVPSLTVDEAYLSDPSNYYWAFTMDQKAANKATQWAYRVDLDYDLDTGGVLKSLRVGGRYTDRDALNKESPYNWQAVSQNWQLGWFLPRLAYLSEFPAESSTYKFNNYYHGNANVPTQVIFPATSLATGYPDSYNLLHSFTETLCKELNPSCDTAFQLAAFGDAQRNEQHEQTYALYGTVRFGLDNMGTPLSGNLGLRYVNTKARTSGFLVTPQPVVIPDGQDPADYPVFDGSSSVRNYRNNYDYWLPSLNLLYKFTPKLQARFAVSRGMARPDFNQMQGSVQLNAAVDTANGRLNLTATANNPLLKPTTADQVDGALEWYFGRASSLTATVFYKKLHNIIRNTLVSEDYDGLTYAVTRPENVGTGELKGFEIGYNQSFDFLPGVLSGLGLTSNFTYVDSKSTINSTLDPNSSAFASVNGVDTNGAIFGKLPLEGLSKYSYNIAGYYEKGPISLRLAYNWRSKYLLAVNVNGTQGTDGTPLAEGGVTCNTAANPRCVTWGLPVYNDDYGQLDGSIFFKPWGDKISIGIEAQNLANAENRVLMQQSAIGTRTRAWFVSDRRFTGTVRVTF
ncbi:TonB-dependent receptor [Sphingomonas sp. RS6]